MIRLGRVQRRVIRELENAGGALDTASIHGALVHFPRARGALLRSLRRLERRGLLIRATFPIYDARSLSTAERARLRGALCSRTRPRVVWVLSDRLAADWQERSAKCTKLEE